MIIFIIPERISNDHICFSAYIRNNTIITEVRSSLDARISKWDLISILISPLIRCLAMMIPPNPIREIIIFITTIIFLI
jgi:hypothetical protein